MAVHEQQQAAGALNQAAHMVTEAKADLDKISKTLNTQVMSIESHWQGSGGQAFFALHNAWVEKQNTIVSALDHFSQSLTTTDRKSTNNDDTVSSYMAGIQKGLS